MLCIDDFRLTSSQCDLHVLTHVHSDHMNIPKKFSGPILCSPLTASLTMLPQLQPVKPGWHNDMLIFDTNHIPGSIGVFYNNTLHVGENRLTAKHINKIDISIQSSIKDGQDMMSKLDQHTYPILRLQKNAKRRCNSMTDNRCSK